MNLERSPFSILDKDKREMDYIKGVYKRKIQAEIESYKDPEELAYYNKIRKEMDDMKKQPIKKGISLNWDTSGGMDK